jgi:hypothetical protein
MTLEEIKYEAERHGYKLVKQNIPMPSDYKRNRKQEFLDFLLMVATCLGTVVALYFLLLL